MSKVTEKQLEDLAAHGGKFYFVGDLSSIFIVPDLATLTAEENSYIQTILAINVKGVKDRYLSKGGRTIAGLLAYNMAVLYVHDVLHKNIERVIERIFTESCGASWRNLATYRYVIAQERDTKITNEINRLKKDFPNDIVVDIRDRFWYEKLWPNRLGLQEKWMKVFPGYEDEEDRWVVAKKEEAYKKAYEEQQKRIEEQAKQQNDDVDLSLPPNYHKKNGNEGEGELH